MCWALFCAAFETKRNVYNQKKHQNRKQLSERKVEYRHSKRLFFCSDTVQKVAQTIECIIVHGCLFFVAEDKIYYLQLRRLSQNGFKSCR